MHMCTLHGVCYVLTDFSSSTSRDHLLLIGFTPLNFEAGQKVWTNQDLPEPRINMHLRTFSTVHKVLTTFAIAPLRFFNFALPVSAMQDDAVLVAMQG